MKKLLSTVGGGVVGGIAGRNLGALEVAKLFPNFHLTHGNSNEIFAAIVCTILGSSLGYYFSNDRTGNDIQNAIK